MEDFRFMPRFLFIFLYVSYLNTRPKTAFTFSLCTCIKIITKNPLTYIQLICGNITLHVAYTNLYSHTVFFFFVICQHICILMLFYLFYMCLVKYFYFIVFTISQKILICCCNFLSILFLRTRICCHNFIILSLLF